MPNSVVEDIAETIKTRLEAITIANGYTFNVASVLRPKRIDTTELVDKRIVLTQTANNRNDDASLIGNPPAAGRDATFNLRCLIKESEAGSDSLGDIQNIRRADMQKAVGNATNWWTFGGKAVNAMFEDTADEIAGDGGIASASINLVVTYRTDENNPYNVR